MTVSYDGPGPFVQGGIQLLGATRVSIPKPSFYEVGGTFQVKNVAAGSNDGLYTWIVQNGTPVARTLALSSAGTSNAVVVRTFMVATTTASDYVELAAQAAAGNVGTLSLAVPTATPVTSASATITIREV